MSTQREVLEKVVAPWVSRGILEHGYYHLGGAVTRAVDVAGLSAKQLTDAWQLGYDGSPFPPDPLYIDVLRFPMHPLMALERPDDTKVRSWPTYATGFLGGATLAPVWNVRRTRVPRGAELWRIQASGDQELLSVFEGPAAGWRGAAGYYPPIHFVGTRAKTGQLDVPAELENDGATVELVVVAESAPAGFTPVRAQIWHRLAARDEVDSIFELVLTCTYDGVPCRIIQHTPTESRLLLLEDDAATVARLKAEEADIGAFEVTVPTDSLTDVGGSTFELSDPGTPLNTTTEHAT